MSLSGRGGTYARRPINGLSLSRYHHTPTTTHTLTINDTVYLISIEKTEDTLTISLHIPATSRTYSNTFTAGYIHKLTHKTPQALTFTAFCSLLTQVLQTPQRKDTDEETDTSDEPDRENTVNVDVLTVQDLEQLRAQKGVSDSRTDTHSSSHSHTYPDKRYLIVSNTHRQTGAVHYPLPLLYSSNTSTDAHSSSSSLSSPSLSSLTLTIDHLSEALKTARREVREERESRRKKEKQDKQERDHMKAELAWMRAKIQQTEEKRENHTEYIHSSASVHAQVPGVDSSVVAELTARLEHEMKKRQAVELECERWRQKCLQLEQQQLSRIHDYQPSRARERHRMLRPGYVNTARSLGARSASPSYLRPTSSTTAKRAVSPALRSDTAALSSSFTYNRTAQLRPSARSSHPPAPQSLRRSATPPVYTAQPLSASSSSSYKRYATRTPPSPRPRFDPSAYVLYKQQQTKQVQQRRQEEQQEAQRMHQAPARKPHHHHHHHHQLHITSNTPGHPHSTPPSSTDTTPVQSTRVLQNQHRTQNGHHESAIAEDDLGYEDDEPLTDQHQSSSGDLDIDGDKNKENHQHEANHRHNHNHSQSRNNPDKPSSHTHDIPPSQPAAPPVPSTAKSPAVSVHTRLSALQSFLKAEKAKIAAMSRGNQEA